MNYDLKYKDIVVIKKPNNTKKKKMVLKKLFNIKTFCDEKSNNIKHNIKHNSMILIILIY